MGLIIYGRGGGDLCQSVRIRSEPQPNSAAVILAEIDTIRPEGRTPLTRSVAIAADVLRYRTTPSIIVALTDREESCREDPCAVADNLKAASADLTIHVIAFGEVHRKSMGEVNSRCLADLTGGIYVPAQSEAELAAALTTTIGCAAITNDLSNASTVITRLE